MSDTATIADSQYQDDVEMPETTTLPTTLGPQRGTPQHRAASALGQLPEQQRGTVPTTPEPKRTKTQSSVNAEVDNYEKLTKFAKEFSVALHTRATVAEQMTMRLDNLRTTFVDAVAALGATYEKELRESNANYRALTSEITSNAVQFLRIPIDNEDYLAGRDFNELIFHLLKDLGTDHEPTWMTDFSRQQRKVATTLKSNLEHKYTTHCQVLAETALHADFLQTVKDHFQMDYEHKVRMEKQTIMNQLSGGCTIHVDRGVIITNLITIGKDKKIQLQNVRTPALALHRSEDKHLQQVQHTFVTNQQQRAHLSPAKKHPVEQLLRGRPDCAGNFIEPNGTWPEFVHTAINTRFKTSITQERLTFALTPLPDRARDGLSKDNLVKTMLDYPDEHSHYDSPLETERAMLMTTGNLVHSAYKTVTTNNSKGETNNFNFFVDDNLFYFVMNGSELEQLLLWNMIPSNCTWFSPMNLNYTYHEACRHYAALMNENYESEVDWLYVVSIKLYQKNFLSEFNRHYSEWNSYVGRGLVYQLRTRELATMTVVEYTGRDFKAYRNYLNTLQDYWWDHTALIGLADLEKNNALAHALLNCKTSGKFAEYYQNNRFVVDNVLGESLLNFMDKDAKSNLETILRKEVDLGKATPTGKKTTRPDFGGIQASVTEKNSIAWLLRKYKEKLEDDLLREQPAETPMPTTEAMYASHNGQYFPRMEGDFCVLDPASSTGALG